jgi:hypothetical protein
LSDAAAIESGRAAWARLRERGRRDWADWLYVAHAVRIGRDAALEAAGVKTPFGKRYTNAMAEWLRQNGLENIQQQVRYRLLQVLDNLPAIEAWRAGLDEKERDRLNHPDSVWWHWQRSLKAGEPRAPQRRIDRPRAQVGRSHTGCRPVNFSQDAIRRAALAMRENFTNDIFVLARIALEAAIRNESDLVELLPAAPPISAKKTAPQLAHAEAA